MNIKNTLSVAALSLGLCALPCAAASAPVGDMSALSLAAEYYGAVHGHRALYDFDSSALASHLLRLHYSPVPWLRLTGGAGGGFAYASPSIEGAEAGFALALGVGLYTPRFLGWLSLTAGYDYLYMAAKEKSVTYRSRAVPRPDFIGFDTVRYVGAAKNGGAAAFIHAPSAGVIFRLGRFAECEVGGVYHYFNVAKKERTLTNTEYDDGGAAKTDTIYKAISDGGEFTDQARLYAAVTLHERESGAYIAGGAAYALTNAVEGNKTILPNFSFWGQVGLIMRDPRGARGDAFRHERRGGAYAELKAREERMAEALNSGAGRGGHRRHGPGPQRGGNRTPEAAEADDDAEETEAGSVEAETATTEE